MPVHGKVLDDFDDEDELDEEEDMDEQSPGQYRGDPQKKYAVSASKQKGKPRLF